MRKAIVILFNLLFFLVPLVFYAKTSEVFEFNKIILTYLTTSLISTFWIIRMVNAKKIIFRPTILDIPLIVFFASQLISTLVSVDIRSSIFGYYSRFNGGIISTFCYIILYWAYVSNVKLLETKRLINVAIASGIIVAIYGILEHFGGSISCLLLTGSFTDDCWVQDVRTRVFATLGQPNWMAAYLVALIPLTWSGVLTNWVSKEKFKKFFWIAGGGILFWAILYTKSRSGLIGLGLAGAVFGSLTLIVNKTKKEFKRIIIPGVVISSLILIAVALTGTPWTPSVNDYLSKNNVNSELTTELNKTSEGGTESGDIRKIVWQGAINVWKAYPVFGTGPETFAFTYYMYRTREHNLVSEWDFLYNKAHNEYLNFAANSGTVGLISYIILIGFSIYLITKLALGKNEKSETITLIAILSGYVSVLVTNFFGFSVVITQLFLFIFPAMAVSLGSKEMPEDKATVLSTGQKFTNTLVVLGSLFVINLIWKYFSADVLYARAKAEIEIGSITESVNDLNSAIKKSPGEPLYHDKMAQLYAALAKASIKEKDTTSAAKLETAAIAEANMAMSIAPKNFIVLQNRVNIFSDLSSVNPNHIMESVKVLEGLTAYAPNYAKTYYKLGLVYLIIGQKDLAITNIQKAIELKPNYGDAIRELESLTNQKPQ